MFGTEVQTERDDLEVVATKTGGRIKYIDCGRFWPLADIAYVLSDIGSRG
jgi:hypothetical protein